MRSVLRTMLVVAVGTAIATHATAQPVPEVVKKYVGAVVKTDGVVVAGVVEEMKDGSCRVTLRGGILQTIPADQVKEKREFDTPARQFKQRFADVDKTQAKNLWVLADWCKQNKLLAEEKLTLEELVKLHANSADPMNKQYAQLAKLRLQLIDGSDDDDDDGDDDDGDDDDDDDPNALKKPKALTKEEIQEVRWEEWTRADRTRPYIPLPLLRKFGLTEIRRSEQFASLMGQALTEDDKKQIRFRTDVHALRIYKTHINRILVRHCANQKCHGGSKAKKWRMINKAQPTTGELYANFKVIDKYVNRDSPHFSPLLRAGLKYNPNDRTNSFGLKGHPAPPVWRSKKDIEYKRILKWIRDLKFRQGGLIPYPEPGTEPGGPGTGPGIEVPRPPGWPPGAPWPPREEPVPPMPRR